MDVSIFIFYAIVLAYIGGMIYLANLLDMGRSLQGAASDVPQSNNVPEVTAAQRRTLLRWMLYGVIGMNLVYALLVVQISILQDAGPTLQQLDVQLPPVDRTAAIASFVITLVLGIIAFRIASSDSTRQRAKRFIGERGHYDPDSMVHTVAIVLSLVTVSVTFSGLVVSGGLSGLAQDFEATGISLSTLLIQSVLMIAGAFLGVGMAIRRSWLQSLERLGLRLPTRGDITSGIGVGILLYLLLLVMAVIWEALVPADQIQQQSAAAEQLAQSFNTLPLAFALSLSAAVGEEILFRGALQPILGLFWTSLLFALVHVQYSLTPATLIIFVVALGLGLLRRRQSTSASIIAHFTYNFIQLALAILAAQTLGGG